MYCHLLHRADPDLNMSRFHRVELSTDVFDAITLQRTWGRIGSRGQNRFASFPSTASAEAAATKLVRSKERRGYFSVRSCAASAAADHPAVSEAKRPLLGHRGPIAQKIAQGRRHSRRVKHASEIFCALREQLRFAIRRASSKIFTSARPGRTALRVFASPKVNANRHRCRPDARGPAFGA
ncbi:WGR domain-containing protein [Gemmobacter aquaticus]